MTDIPASNDVDNWAVDWDAEGLSPSARFAYAMTIALIYETKEECVPLRRVLRGTGLTEEEWGAVEAELYDASLVWRRDDGPTRLVTANTAAGRLSIATGAPGRPSARDWQELREEAFRRHGNACVYCGAQDDSLAVDHIRPLNRGGSNHIANLLPACQACNSTKGTRTWSEWYPVSPLARRSDVR